MKVSDFKLLATLPDEYNYSILEVREGIPMILGINHQTAIAFRIINGELRPVSFEAEPKGDEYR